jgi:hypothetical protein
MHINVLLRIFKKIVSRQNVYKKMKTKYKKIHVKFLSWKWTDGNESNRTALELLMSRVRAEKIVHVEIESNPILIESSSNTFNSTHFHP